MKKHIQEDIAKLGTIMSIWAHPDDESYTSAGIMCTAHDNGQNVVCITATKGEAGVQDESRWPADQLAEIRSQEMTEALQVLGVSQHHWLGYEDGHLAEVPEHEPISRLRALITLYQPNTILTFGPEGMTGHPDHCTVSNWVYQAAVGTGVVVYHVVQPRSRYELFKEADKQFNIYFNIDEPPLIDDSQADILFELGEGCLKKKLEALKAMPSQTEAMLTAMGDEKVSEMIKIETFVRADKQNG